MTQGGVAFDNGSTLSARLRGLGAYDTPTDCEMYGSNPPPGCPGYQGSSSGSGSGSGSTKPKTMDLIKEGLNTLSDIWGAYKKPAPGAPPTPSGGKSNNAIKYVLIGTGVLAAAGLTIWAFKRSKKKK